MRTRLIIVILLVLAMAACAARGTGPYQPQTEANRDTTTAERLSREAADIIDSDPAKAEALLRDALTADLYYGPAHNNLGVVYLQQAKLYEAANEFEWAKKLMPGHPDPRMNLAFTLERAGRIDEAIAEYGTALETYPGHVPTMQALTRCQLRHGRSDDRTADFLREVALAGQTDEWRSWALAQLPRVEERATKGALDYSGDE